MFCFRGVRVSIVAGFDQREAALRAIRELCAP
jgi:hypothetical protein